MLFYCVFLVFFQCLICDFFSLIKFTKHLFFFYLKIQFLKFFCKSVSSNCFVLSNLVGGSAVYRDGEDLGWELIGLRASIGGRGWEAIVLRWLLSSRDSRRDAEQPVGG